MTKRIFSFLGLVALMVLMTGLLTAAAPVPVTTITLEQGLPAFMNVGETYTVIVHVTSDQKFTSAQAMPDFQYAGKGVVAVQGGTGQDKIPMRLWKLLSKPKARLRRCPADLCQCRLWSESVMAAGTLLSTNLTSM